ncbi:hypothetical protein HY948_04685 [Candidatus Gottesmanbacteria bacterium]|nr:hypothetical protein [Candidatus Gottesmanbacteria bacterium]
MRIQIKKYPKPILSPGIFSGNFFAPDALWAYHPVAVRLGKHRLLFYTGKSIGLGIRHYTLAARGESLTHWVKTGVVALPNGVEDSWDSDFTAHAYVFDHGKNISMLYDGSRVGDWLEEIGLADSTDGVNWRRYPSNPIFRVGAAWWEKRHVSRCAVYRKKGIYYMYYAGHDGERERVGLATGKTLSSITTRFPKPVLDVGSAGAWDEKSISDPRVIEYGGVYVMFYSGIDASGIERTGAAESRDLIHWKKYSANPVLDVTWGSWDAISASRACPYREGNRLVLYYSGRKNYFYQIGMADVSIS